MPMVMMATATTERCTTGRTSTRSDHRATTAATAMPSRPPANGPAVRAQAGDAIGPHHQQPA